MVKVHDGFINDSVAKSCLAACMLDYSNMGYLVTAWVHSDCHIYSIDVHHSRSEILPVFRGLEPSRYDRHFVKSDVNSDVAVTTFYFDVCQSSNLEL